jgi:hypothetical protein
MVLHAISAPAIYEVSTFSIRGKVLIALLAGVALACDCAEPVSLAVAHSDADDVVLAELRVAAGGNATFIVRESFRKRGRRPGELFALRYATDVDCGVSFDTVGQLVLFLSEGDPVYDSCDLQSAVRHGNGYRWDDTTLLYADFLDELRRLRRTARRGGLAVLSWRRDSRGSTVARGR